MTNFSVGPTPIQLVGAGVDNEPLTVQNTGAVSIYLSADPGVRPAAFEYKIDAGGDFTWPPGKSLSVCTGPGVTGQISFGGTGNVRVNSGSTNVTGNVTINGSVPIAGPVTVSGSVALNAGSVVAIAGPVAIAGTVPISGNVNIAGGTVALSGPVTISGGVSVNGSTVNVGTPVKLSNNVTVIGNYTFAILNGNNVRPLQGPFDITPYASVIIQIYNNAGTSIPVISNWIDLLITTSGTAGSTYLNPQFIATTGPTQSIQIPVTGSQLYFNITSHINGAFAAGSFFVNILGSGETITNNKYVSQGDGMMGGLTQGGTFHQLCNAATTTAVFLNTKNGPATVTIYPNNAAYGFLYLNVANNGALEQFNGTSTNGLTGGSSNVVNTILPLRPINAQLLTSAGSIFDATIIQQ